LMRLRGACAYGCASCHYAPFWPNPSRLVMLFVVHPAAARHGNDGGDGTTGDYRDDKGAGETPLLSRAGVGETFTRGAW